MSWVSWIFVVLSVGLSSLAQLSMKIGMARIKTDQHSLIDALVAITFSPFIIFGLSIYGVGAALWLVVLSKVPLSSAYPLVSLGFVFVAFLSWSVLGEALPLMRLAGIALILAGVILVGSS